jgi:hypothetical protein
VNIVLCAGPIEIVVVRVCFVRFFPSDVRTNEHRRTCDVHDVFVQRTTSTRTARTSSRLSACRCTSNNGVARENHETCDKKNENNQ